MATRRRDVFPGKVKAPSSPSSSAAAAKLKSAVNKITKSNVSTAPQKQTKPISKPTTPKKSSSPATPIKPAQIITNPVNTAVAGPRSSSLSYKAAVTSPRSSPLSYKAVVTSPRSSALPSKPAAASPRRSPLSGKASAASPRPSSLSGKASAASPRSSPLSGKANVATTRSSPLSGKASAAGTRSSPLSGNPDAASPKQVLHTKSLKVAAKNEGNNRRLSTASVRNARRSSIGLIKKQEIGVKAPAANEQEQITSIYCVPESETEIKDLEDSFLAGEVEVKEIDQEPLTFTMIGDGIDLGDPTVVIAAESSPIPEKETYVDIVRKASNQKEVEVAAEKQEEVVAMKRKREASPAAKQAERMHGKIDVPVSNDVIEETAMKLIEQKKNRVRALASAFESVILLQEK